MDIVLDIETLGIKPSSVILSIGAVRFDPYSTDPPYDPWYVRLDVDYQLNQLGRTVDESTLAWWEKQDPAIRDDALSTDNRISIDEFSKQFNQYVVGTDCLWAQGATFDFVLIEDLYRNLGQPSPINYWTIRDSRTLFKSTGLDSRKLHNNGHHNALNDAIAQSVAIQQIYQEFNFERPMG